MVVLTITYDWYNHTPFAAPRITFKTINFLIELDGSSDLIW